MRKLLLSMSMLACVATYAQDQAVLEDCSTMTIGNVSTDLTGTTPGQNGWGTYVSATASDPGQLSNFQVVDAGGTNLNAFQLTGTTASVTGNARYLYKDISTEWTNRTAGNDIAQVEYDFYTGDVTTSANTIRTYIFDSTGATAMCGFYFVPATMVLKGWAQYDNAGTVGYYIFGLGASGDVTLSPNTWYRIAVAFDYNTGDVTWKDAAGLIDPAGAFVTGADAGMDVGELDFVATTPAAANTSAAVVKYDNVNVNFSAVESLLSVKNNSFVSSNISVYPNPSKDFVTIANKGVSINNIEITDINGRVVKTVKGSTVSDVQINISDLNTGVYMMKISSEQGSVTKKVIKE